MCDFLPATVSHYGVAHVLLVEQRMPSNPLQVFSPLVEHLLRQLLQQNSARNVCVYNKQDVAESWICGKIT